ncbi:hypothetical protein CRENBAI_014114, partial [Crenichthys baileyi]
PADDSCWPVAPSSHRICLPPMSAAAAELYTPAAAELSTSAVATMLSMSAVAAVHPGDDVANRLNSCAEEWGSLLLQDRPPDYWIMLREH